MTKEQALKFKEWLTHYVDLDVKVINSQIMVMDNDGGVFAERGRKVCYRGRTYVIDKFIYVGALRDDNVIHGDRIAKYARLRPDNGVFRTHSAIIKTNDDTCWLDIHSQTKALETLDEIIKESDKHVWAEVYYNDGILHLRSTGLVGVGRARLSGDTAIICDGCNYVIVGYRDTPKIDVVDMHGSPVKDSHVYKYCLLEKV